MSESIRRHLDEQAKLQALMNPARELRHHIGASNAIYEAMGIDRMTMEIVQGEADRLKTIAGLLPTRTLGVLENARDILCSHPAYIAGAVEEARRLKLLDPTHDIRRSVDDMLAARAQYEQEFRLPHQSEVARLAQEAIEATSLAGLVQGGRMGIEQALAKMHLPWIRDVEAGASAKALAELIGIGQGIQRQDPFDVELSKSLRRALGDWRGELLESHELVDPVLRAGLYRARGVDSALVDFPSTAFHEGLQIAGLDAWREVESDQPGDDEETDDSAEAFRAIRFLEVEVRRFIAARLEGKYGEHWPINQLPGSMLQAWKDKKARDTTSGRDLPLIEYADFSDYMMIIERKDNWRDVFEPVFKRKEDVQESFRRLAPVRIATMHSRLILKEDLLLLASEVTRLLKAISTTAGVR